MTRVKMNRKNKESKKDNIKGKKKMKAKNVHNKEKHLTRINKKFHKKRFDKSQPNEGIKDEEDKYIDEELNKVKEEFLMKEKEQESSMNQDGVFENDSTPMEVENPVLTETERLEIDSRTIFVGNLPLETTPQKLKQLFSNYGHIESTRIRCFALNASKKPRWVALKKRDFHDKASSLNGYVKFTDIKSVTRALAVNGTQHEGHQLRVDRVGLAKPDEETKNSVFLGNLPFDVSDNEVIEAFRECGEIESVHIIRDNSSGLGKGFGYINFKTNDAIELALRLNETLIKKRPVRVKRTVKSLGEKRKNDKWKSEEMKPFSKSEFQNEKRPPREKKKKQKKPDFQGRTVNKAIKKKKPKRKLKNERKKKKILEVLNKVGNVKRNINVY